MGIICILLVTSFFNVFLPAQAQSNYYVTVKPTTSHSPMYTMVGFNWTVSFEALWSFGVNSGKPLQNATTIIEITDNESKRIDDLSVKSDISGIIFL